MQPKVLTAILLLVFSLLQKTFTVDFLTKKRKEIDGQVNQYYIANNFEAIIDTKI